MYIITIDGPSSSGKSTVAAIVAKNLNIAHINSGEAYRAIAYLMLNKGIEPNDIVNIRKELQNNTFKMVYNKGKQSLYVNNEDITAFLHTNQINAVVSQYGKNEEVIYKASDMAREVSQDINVVMEGRNLGSFCFPDAKYKFFVDCDVKERALRRFNEMLQKGADVDFETIYKQTIERDNLDKTRKVAPLVVPENSILIDSTHLTPDEVADKIVEIVKDMENTQTF